MKLKYAQSGEPIETVSGDVSREAVAIAGSQNKVVEITSYERDLIKLGRTEERFECLNRRIDAALAEYLN